MQNAASCSNISSKCASYENCFVTFNRLFSRPFRAVLLSGHWGMYSHTVYASLAETVRILVGQSKRVVLLGALPRFDNGIYETNTKITHENARLQAIASKYNSSQVQYADFLSYICGSGNMCCKFDSFGVLFYNEDHLSPRGARRLARKAIRKGLPEFVKFLIQQ
jgi:hypothetical protein